MKPVEYVPVFDSSVLEYWSGNPEQTWPINEQYCLMQSSAVILASFWTPTPKIYTNPPIPQATGSPYRFNHDVPWLEFANGEKRNAAQLAVYWVWFANDPIQAWYWANVDIKTPV